MYGRKEYFRRWIERIEIFVKNFIGHSNSFSEVNIIVDKGVDQMQSQGNNNTNMQNLYNDCRAMMNYHVILRMKDGREIDGIIESVEPDSVNVLTGEDVIMRDDDDNSRQTQYYSPRRYRRFRRSNFPLANLLALSLLPYPYYAPPYPYAQPYPYYPY